MVVSLVVDVAFSAAALRLRQLLPVPPIPRASTARSRSPRANAAALDPLAAPPRRLGRAGSPWSTNRARIRGLSIVLGSPPLTVCPHCARGGVAPLVVVHDGPAAAATGLPPVSSYAPTPLAEAGSVRLSPPPTVDSRPHRGPPVLAFRFAGWPAVFPRQGGTPPGRPAFPVPALPNQPRRQRELPAILSGSTASRTRPNRGPQTGSAPTAGNAVLPLS